MKYDEFIQIKNGEINFPKNTILIDANENAHSKRAELWKSFFNKKTDSYVKIEPLPAGDIAYYNKKGQWIGVEFKKGIDLTISQDSKHLHSQIDKMAIFDKSYVVATKGFTDDYDHLNYFSKWSFKNIYPIYCNNFEEATEEIKNIFEYSNQEAWIPEAYPEYSCKLGALKAIGNGIGDKLILELYRKYPTLDSLLSETDFTGITGIGEKKNAIIIDCLHNT